ncbi:MAG: GLUG motif-containing protein, partial [Candidatus ainarchaeum sp.]|nr:GLUG motif-containing protein [Candidatus ainarchaeum sp.]
MNKKFFLIQFFLLLIIGFAFSDYLPGTIQNPYKIIDCDDLQNMKNDLNAVYALQNDITCYNPITQEMFDFKSIGGNGGEEFSGRLNGNGFTIRGLRPLPVKKDDSYLGLFGEIKNAQVTNLRIVLDSRDINNDSFYNDQIFFGGLAGKAINSDINGVIVEGEWGYEGIVSIDGEYVDENYTYFHMAGGLIGIAENTYISGCVNRVNFKGGYYYLGGIVGWAENTIIYNSKNKADIQPYYNNYSDGECVQLFNGYIGGIASVIIS